MKVILEKYLKKYPFTIPEIEKIIGTLQPLSLKKGECFSEQGKICRRLGILMNGLLYAFYYSDKCGKRVSRFFYLPDNPIVTSFESFSNSKEAEDTIIAIEDCNLFYLTNSELQMLYREIPTMNILGRHLAEQSYVQAMQRVHSLQALNTRQRFEKFLKEHPDLVNKLQKNHLNSYLGMNRNMVTKHLKTL